METNSAKVLDEACNCNNEVYRDEALYATWAGEAANDATLAPPLPHCLRADIDSFMARLNACQE